MLFTDWVDSTRTAVRLGAAADDLRRIHFALLRGALTATGGSEVKGTGDGLMAEFDSAADAIRCAQAMQRAFAHHNSRAVEPMAIRIGISGGDVVADDNDLFGIPVIEAARLCDAAAGGEILLTRVVAVLAGNSGEATFHDLGARQLKGLDGPTDVLGLAWSPERAGEDLIGLPAGVLRSLDGPALVGRDMELAALGQAWADVLAGQRRVVLLEGEPGAGKTRLAGEQARVCATEGALVLFGRCDPDVRSALRPWATVFRDFVAVSDPRALAAHVAAHGGELTRIAPALADRVPDVPAPAGGDEESERHRLTDACAGLLTAAAGRQPVVVVLDDLNWADRASLVLLRHVVRSVDVPLLVVATARDAETDRGEPYRQLLGDLLREPGTVRLAVGGLDERSTLELLQQLVGEVETAPALAQALRDETDGNPLFTIELLRRLRDEGNLDDALARPGAWLAMSDTVRDVIAQRVSALGADMAPVLGAAAVLGRSFDADLLAELVEGSEDQVLVTLERACTAALLSESPYRPGRFTFAHGLVQRVLADGLSAARGQLLHRRAAELLQRDLAADPARAGEVAAHWLAAGERDRRHAQAAALTAGRQALQMLAPEEAAEWFERVLHLAMTATDRDERTIAETLLALGDAERRAGDERYREHLLRAADIAQREGHPDLLVRAALANSRGLTSSFLEADEERIAVLRSALLVAEEGDPATRALLQATLASELWRDREQRLTVADSALTAARQAGDPAVLVQVLYRRCLTIAEPATVAQRLDITAELIGLTDALDEPMWQLRAAAERMRVCMEAGLGEEGVAQTRRQIELAPRTGNAMATYIATTSQAWLHAHEGDYLAAEELAQIAAQQGAGVSPDAFAIFGAQLLPFRWDQGTLGDLADLVITTAAAPGALSSQRAVLPLALHEAGRGDEAVAAVDDALRDDLPLTLDTLAGVTAVLWAESIGRTRHEQAAARLLGRIAPWSDQVAFSGVSNFGSIARGCGLLAALLGRHDEAAGHFAAAERVDRAVGSVGPLARTLADHAEWLVANGERDAARVRLTEAQDLARRHGLTGIAERCAAIGVLVEERTA